jgi:recombination protein RecT
MTTGLRDRVHEKTVATTGTDGGGEGAVEKQDSVRALLDSMASEFSSVLPPQIPLDYFIRVATSGLKTTPALAACSRQSLFMALLDCAQVGLLPCTEQAAIIPFKGVATFVPQYQGYIEIFHRTGKVARVELDWKYTADRMEYVKGDNPRFQHWPNYETEDRGTPVLAYAFLRYKDGTRSDISILSRAQAIRIRDNHSKAYQKAERDKTYDSPWHTNFDDMWLKSALRRLAKYVPKTPELSLLLAKDIDGGPDDSPGGSPVVQFGPSTIAGEVIDDEDDDDDVTEPTAA